MMYAHVNKKNGEPAPLVSEELYNTVMEVCVWWMCHHLVRVDLFYHSMLSASTASSSTTVILSTTTLASR